MSRMMVCGVMLAALVNAPNLAAGLAVETAPARAAHVVREITVYGSVEPDPAATAVVALPRAGVIRRVLVRLGERVAAGQALIEVDTAPGPRLQYDQARAALQYAQAQVEAVQRLLAQQLATREQLAQAQRELSDARATEESLRAVGADAKQQTLRAPQPGIVTQLLVSAGDRTLADAQALNLVATDGLIVRLGVEPEVARVLPVAAPVRLTGVFDDVAIDTTITQIHAMLNPTTRLVDVIVAIPVERAADLTLGSQIRGVIAGAAVEAWLVPRSAVLRDETGDYVFTINADRARRCDVEVVLDQGADLAVRGPLNSGDRVVVAGNYQLSDGAAVTSNADH